MALFLQHRSDHCRWAVWKMEETVEELLARLPDERHLCCIAELQRFSSERRKVEWLSVRVLLSSMLGADKQICYAADGKPYLADHSFFISISHTRGYAAVMLSDRSPVGIDIELYGKRVQKVADRFMRPDEQAAEYKGDVTWSLLLHWSAKEAVFKCMEDADADLRKLRLLPFVPQAEGTLQVRECVTVGQEVFSVGYSLGSDFVLTYLEGSG